MTQYNQLGQGYMRVCYHPAVLQAPLSERYVCTCSSWSCSHALTQQDEGSLVHLILCSYVGNLLHRNAQRMKLQCISFSRWSAQRLLAVVKLETHYQFDCTGSLSHPHTTSRVCPFYQC